MQKEYEVVIDYWLNPSVYWTLDYLTWQDIIPEGATNDERDAIVTHWLQDRVLRSGLAIQDYFTSRTERAQYVMFAGFVQNGFYVDFDGFKAMIEEQRDARLSARLEFAADLGIDDEQTGLKDGISLTQLGRIND